MSAKMVAGRMGLKWGKGTKRLVRKAQELGYELKYKEGNIIMRFVGHCPPYQKRVGPILKAIRENKYAVIQYLKYLETMEEGGKSEDESL